MRERECVLKRENVNQRIWYDLLIENNMCGISPIIIWLVSCAGSQID